MNKKIKKLHLGCGEKILSGYINIDLFSKKADMKYDIKERLPFPDGSISEIYAQHIIEHFNRFEWDKIRQDWSRVLKKGGKLIIECPDIIRCMKRYIDDTDNLREKLWIQTIYGKQESFGPGQDHKNGFYFEKIEKHLNDVGLSVISYSYLHHDIKDDNGFNIRVEAKK